MRFGDEVLAAGGVKDGSEVVKLVGEYELARDGEVIRANYQDF